MRPLLLLRGLLKAHNPGYTKKDGTFVKPFDDKRAAAKKAPPKPIDPHHAALQDELAAEQAKQASLFPSAKKPHGGPTKPPPASTAKWTALGSIKGAAGKLAAKIPGRGLFGGYMAADHAKDLGQPVPKPMGPTPPQRPATAVPHPREGEKGERVWIHYPSTPSEPATWHDPHAIATFTPGSPVPAELNGVPFAPWEDAPKSDEEWDYVAGQNEELEEPGMELEGGRKPASGVIVLEPDGRAWVIAPTNRFGNTRNTFPKGGREEGLSLQANAIKEAYEESGLQVEIDSFLGDVTRTTSVARYYLARRVGGTPAAMGWESQAVRLVPVDQLRDFLDRGEDKQVAEWLEGLV